MQQYLGLDWGQRKIGVALADGETRIAHAHAIIPTTPDVYDVLTEIVEAHGVTVIVVGVPVHRGHGNTGAYAHAFAKELAALFPAVQVVCVDEMFTTKMARAGRVASGKKGADDDAEAARILLQEYLDAGGGEERPVY